MSVLRGTLDYDGEVFSHDKEEKYMKKVNPHRRPATQADVIKAKNKAVNEAVKLAWTILFSVLWDKEHYTPEDMQRVWKEVDNLSDSIVKGYCNVSDLREVLKREAGVCIE